MHSAFNYCLSIKSTNCIALALKIHDHDIYNHDSHLQISMLTPWFIRPLFGRQHPD